MMFEMDTPLWACFRCQTVAASKYEDHRKIRADPTACPNCGHHELQRIDLSGEGDGAE